MTRRHVDSDRQSTKGHVLIAALDFSVAVAAFGLHQLLRGLARGSPGTAMADAQHVIDLERAVGLFLEVDMQRWVRAHPLLLWLLYAAYSYLHLAVLILFLLWVLLRHRDRFGEIFVTFLLTIGGALLVYYLFPVAPPRLFPELGFVDTVQRFAGVNMDASAQSLLANPFAAMPSLHVAWALLISLGVIRLVRRPLSWLALGYWLLMSVAVVATANHFILDVLAGTLLTVLAYVAAPHLLPRISWSMLLRRTSVHTFE